MTKEDWIILRLIFVATKTNNREAYHSLDMALAMAHLLRTYGIKKLNKCIDQLRGEYFK